MPGSPGAGIEKLLATQGLDPMSSTPAEFAAYMRQETAKWSKVVRDAHIKID